MTLIDATGCDPSELLAELYNNAKSLGMGIYQYQAKLITPHEALLLLSQTKNFDYLLGRCIKVNLENFPLICSFGYDREYGQGALQKIVNNVKLKITTGTIPRDMPTKSALKETIEQCKISIGDLSNTVFGNNLNKFDKVWFTDSFCKQLEQQNFPYPRDWCMYMETIENTARFMGSMVEVSLLILWNQ